MNAELAQELLDDARALGTFTPAQLAMRAGVRLRVAQEFLESVPHEVECCLVEGHDLRRPRRAFWRVRSDVPRPTAGPIGMCIADPGTAGELQAAGLRQEVRRLLDTVEQTVQSLQEDKSDPARARRDLRAALIYLDAVDGHLLDLRSRMQAAAVALEQRTSRLRRQLLASAQSQPEDGSTYALAGLLQRRIFDWTLDRVTADPVARTEDAATVVDDLALDVLRALVAAAAGHGDALLAPAVRAAGLRATQPQSAWQAASGHLVRAIARLLRSEASPELLLAATLLSTELDDPEAGLAGLQLAMRGTLCQQLAPAMRSLCFAAFSRLTLSPDLCSTRHGQARACLYLLDDHRDDPTACLLVPGAILGRLVNAGEMMLAMPGMVFTGPETDLQVRPGLNAVGLVRTMVFALHQANSIQAFARNIPLLLLEPRGRAWFRCCVGNAADALIVGTDEEHYVVAASHRITGTDILDASRRATFSATGESAAETQLAQALTERTWDRRIDRMSPTTFTRQLGSRYLN